MLFPADVCRRRRWYGLGNITVWPFVRTSKYIYIDDNDDDGGGGGALALETNQALKGNTQQNNA